MNNGTAWVRNEEFNRWLYDLNMNFKLKNKKILLISDNCPSHRVKIEITNVEMIFLPKNSTSRLQPLDAGIISSFKAKFYEYQLSSIVEKITNEVHIEKLYKSITLKDALIFAKYAWVDVSKETIKIFVEKL
ncbi:Tigger transposable element-derived protein 6 [Dictyocoela muelleri]|nr:Tigger transposable element-derived protein 6 [Dictyocoela muelleri]